MHAHDIFVFFVLLEFNADLLLQGPYFIKQPVDVEFFLEEDDPSWRDDSISFECEARGVPQPNYTWYEETQVCKSQH